MRGEGPKELSKREKEVLDALLLGLTDKEIGVKLGMAASTAGYHLWIIRKKLGITGSYTRVRLATAWLKMK